MNKKALITKLTLLCSGFMLFISCSNMLASQGESASARGCETGSVVFNGSICVTGALPSSLNESRHAELDSASLAQEIPCQARNDNTSARNDSVASRSALPSYNIGIDSYYYVTATKTDGSEASNINNLSNSTSFTTTNGVTFALTLTNGSWNIEAGIKKANSTGIARADDVSVMSETYPVTISAADPVVSHTFYPKPSQKGSGNVALNISYDSGTVNSVTAKCGNESWPVIPGTQPAIVKDSIKSGTYDLSIYFYKDDENENNILVYSTVQTINVFDNMLTNTWVSDGSGLISGTGDFNLTADLVSQFARTTFYVGSTSVGAASDITGNGSPYAPFATVTKVAEVIAATGNRLKDYRIYVSGTVTGAQEISEGVNGKANSITIQGYNGLDTNGEPKDSLNGTSGNSVTRPLNIKSKVPVTITNLKITGGNIGGNGGGIYIDTGTNVLLGDGVLVTGNTAVSGGGIYNLGKLYLYGSAMVGKKTDTVATSTSKGNKATKSGAGIYNQGSLYLGYSSWTSESDNKSAPLTGGVCGNYNANATSSTAFGGGIYNKGQIYIASGNVSNNYAHYGAGVCTESAVAMTGGTIEGNEGDNNYSAGGGIYVYGSNGSFSMSGDAVIKNNRNITYGAGVYILYNSSFEMTGGTIENNTATSTGFGGAVYVQANAADEYCDFKIGADAYIPYGEKKNDIHMCNGWAKIKISSSLAKHSASDQIMLNLHNNYYSNGNPLLIAESGVILANEVGKFKVPQYVSLNDGRKDYSLDSEGKLLEGLILPSSSSDMVSGKTYAVADSSDIKKLVEFSNNDYDFTGVTLKLGADITIGTVWTPIGNETAFRGTFDGNEKTVTFATEAIADAVFGTVGGTVKNLKVAGSTHVAGIAKEANGASALIENCESSATVTSSEQYCAGIVAYVNNATIKGCVNNGRVISMYVTDQSVGISLKGAGGITGPIQNGGIIDSCTNTGSVTGLGAGGITSFIDTSCTIRNSQNSGDITSRERYAGGIVGVASGDGNDLSKAPHIDNCFNSGSVTASGTGVSVYAGGIAGQLGGGNIACAKNCLNIGNVSLSPSAASGSKVGALFGTKWNKSTVDYCYYREGCAGSSFGIGGSTSDTTNECIKATQSGSNNAVISVSVTVSSSVGGTINSFNYPANFTVCDPLNTWVDYNNSDNLYLEWETDSNHWPKLKAGQ